MALLSAVLPAGGPPRPAAGPPRAPSKRRSTRPSSSASRRPAPSSPAARSLFKNLRVLWVRAARRASSTTAWLMGCAAVEPLARRRGARAAVGAGDGEARLDRAAHRLHRRGRRRLPRVFGRRGAGAPRQRVRHARARYAGRGAKFFEVDLPNVVEAKRKTGAGYCGAQRRAGACARRRPQRGGGRRARAARGRRRRLLARGAHARRDEAVLFYLAAGEGKLLAECRAGRRRRRLGARPRRPRALRPRPRAPGRRHVLATWASSSAATTRCGAARSSSSTRRRRQPERDTLLRLFRRSQLFIHSCDAKPIRQPERCARVVKCLPVRARQRVDAAAARCPYTSSPRLANSCGASSGQFRPRRASRALACVSQGAKTTAADTLVQKAVEGREALDLGRAAAFTVFGTLWMGGAQYCVYVACSTCCPRGPPRPRRRGLPRPIRVGALLLLPGVLRDRLQDPRRGGTGVGALLTAASERYKREIYETCTTTYWFSFPAQMIGFRFCPGHLRIPYVACCSMVFTSLVSGLQGRFRARERGETGG